MGNELQLGFEEPQVEGAPQAAETGLVEIGRFPQLPGPPEQPDDTGKIGEGRLPVHLAGSLHCGSGQNGLLRRKAILGFIGGVMQAQGLFGQAQDVAEGLDFREIVLNGHLPPPFGS